MKNIENNTLLNGNLLADAVAHGIIDSDLLRQQVEMAKRKEVIKKHNEAYSCWEDKDGYWNTYLPGELGGRKRVKKKSREEMENAIVAYYTETENNPTLQRVFFSFYSWETELIGAK